MFNSTMQIHPSEPPKNPIIAALLSLLLFGGVGQMYLGQTKKGVIIIVASILLACVGIGFLIPFIGAVDAYMMAEKLQKGESIGDMQWFWEN